VRQLLNSEKFYNTPNLGINDIISSGLLELYVTGAASPGEVLQVEKWASIHPEIKEEIAGIQSALEIYAFENAVQPDPSVKQKILSRINGNGKDETPVIRLQHATIDTERNDIEKTERNDIEKRKDIKTETYSEPARVYRIPSPLRWAVAACIILLAGSVVMNVMYFNKYKSASSNLQVAQNELQHQKDVASAMNKAMDIMGNKNALPVALNGTPKAPDAAARIYWMKNNGDVYVDPSNLPQTPSGMQYQLWAIVDGKPVDAGMITTPKGTYHIQKMKSFGKAEAFAITLEKAGGSPTPTMDRMYVMAKI